MGPATSSIQYIICEQEFFNVIYLLLTVIFEYIFYHRLSTYIIEQQLHHIDVHGLLQEDKVVLCHPKAKEWTQTIKVGKPKI